MTDPADLPAGQRFANRYVIRKRLGLGGMGAVYVAHDENTDSECALKVLYGRALVDARALEDFQREAKITGPFTGEARGLVVRVTDAGLERSLKAPFLVMELLDGEELADRIARAGRLDPVAVAGLARQLAIVLDEAHRRGIVHRDLKPENLFLARVGPVEVLKVLDFGIARVLRENASLGGSRIIGSPLFMAPEQWGRTAAVGPATDLWALGLIVFRALAGDAFWRSRDVAGLAAEILVHPLPAASARAAEYGVTLPPGFDAWFARCVCRDPAGRFSTAGEAVAALDAVFHAQGHPGHPGHPAHPGHPDPAPAATQRLEAPRPPPVPAPRRATEPCPLGEGLDDRLRARGPLSAHGVAEVMLQVAEALEALRAANPSLGHLTPARVRFVRAASGHVVACVPEIAVRAVVVGEGAARRTATLPITADDVAYLAPEALRLRAGGAAGDVWALGLIAFEALTGARFVSGDDVPGVLAALSRALPRASEHPAVSARAVALPAGFDAWLARCTSGDPAARFAGPVPAALALRHLVGAPAAATRERLGSGATWGIAAGAAGSLGLVALGLALWPAGTPAPTRARADVPAPAAHAPPRAPAPAPATLASLGDRVERTNPFLPVLVQGSGGGFAVQRHEVTQGEYALWSEGRRPAVAGEEGLPVTAVEWDAARRFCEALHAALPTQEQWLRALDDRTGWADRVHPGGAIDSVEARPTDVSPTGVHDLVGGVSEWLEDAPQPGRHAYIGASFADDPGSVAWLVSHARSAPTTPDAAERLRVSRSRGFRCARALRPFAPG